jgi:hypothetical protein
LEALQKVCNLLRRWEGGILGFVLGRGSIRGLSSAGVDSLLGSGGSGRGGKLPCQLLDSGEVGVADLNWSTGSWGVEA